MHVAQDQPETEPEQDADVEDMAYVYRHMTDKEAVFLLEHSLLPDSQPYQTIVEGTEGYEYCRWTALGVFCFCHVANASWLLAGGLLIQFADPMMNTSSCDGTMVPSVDSFTLNPKVRIAGQKVAALAAPSFRPYLL